MPALLRFSHLIKNPHTLLHTGVFKSVTREHHRDHVKLTRNPPRLVARVTPRGGKTQYNLSSTTIIDLTTGKKSSTSKRDLMRIVASPQDLNYIPPIRYAYDPVPTLVSHLQPLSFSFISGASQPCAAISDNTVPVYPLSAGLPYRSSLNHVGSSKHFRANILEAAAVLSIIAADKSATDAPVGGTGITLGRIAKDEMAAVADKMTAATIYMFPAADEKKLRLIASATLLYFIFDEKVEQAAEGEPLNNFRDVFFSHFQDPASFAAEPTSDFQRYTRELVEAIWEKDPICGSGGREMIEALKGAFCCVHPEGAFQSVDDYLRFRRFNVGAPFVIAAAKFSISSGVDIEDPRFKRFVRLIMDHICVVNDVASFDKEHRALKRGDTEDMINIVDVIQELLSLPSEEAAKEAAYSYQLQLESWIMAELEGLAGDGSVTDEEWWFLEVALLSATGNTFFCMTSQRYGGKAASIDALW